MKELVDVGISSICTHYCLNCYSNPLIVWCKTYNREEDFSFMCLVCALRHKREMPDHYLQNLYQGQEIQSILKKNEMMTALVKEELANLMEKRVSDELNGFCERLFECCE